MSESQAVKARLYLVQHGFSVSKEENPDRPLSEEGEKSIERLAELFADGAFGGDIKLCRLLHSGKLRAEQTAEIIADGSGLEVRPERISGISPNDDPNRFISDQDLYQMMSSGDIMIVSHMPFISSLCSTLLTGKATVEFDFTPGSVACLFYEYEEWSMQCMVRPDIYN